MISIGQFDANLGSICCPTVGYSSRVRAKTRIALMRAGITMLPKNGANSMSPDRRTPMVSRPVMIVIRGNLDHFRYP